MHRAGLPVEIALSNGGRVKFENGGKKNSIYSVVFRARRTDRAGGTVFSDPPFFN